MKKHINYLALVAAALFTLVRPAGAWPLKIYTLHDPIQDDWSISGWAHELGNEPTFPEDERIESWEVPWGGWIPCPTDYKDGVVVQVAMRNLTGRTFYEGEVFYVADAGTSLSNWDEWVGQVDFDPGQAFMIDRRAALGGQWGQKNTPLVAESFIMDGIWQPGEIWQFVIQDYTSSWNGSPADFGSLGIGGASGGGLSTGSIVIIPEPGTAMLLLLGGWLLAFGTRRRSR